MKNQCVAVVKYLILFSFNFPSLGPPLPELFSVCITLYIMTVVEYLVAKIRDIRLTLCTTLKYHLTWLILFSGTDS